MQGSETGDRGALALGDWIGEAIERKEERGR
jgi:hypothetical protein